MMVSHFSLNNNDNDHDDHHNDDKNIYILIFYEYAFKYYWWNTSWLFFNNKTANYFNTIAYVDIIEIKSRNQSNKFIIINNILIQVQDYFLIFF